MDVFLDHIDRAVDQQEIDRQRRIAAQKFREQGRDHEPAHQAWRTDPDPPRWLVTVARQRRLDLPDLTDDRFGAFVKNPALVGEGELARRAQQEAGPEMLLQRRDLPAYRRQ